MRKLDNYFDEIDLARIRRVKELSEIKRQFISSRDLDPMGVQSKAVVVLSYASWEGFYNECVTIYHQFLFDQGAKVVDAGWLMLVGALAQEFESLRSRNHSSVAKRDFVASLKMRLQCGLDQFDLSTVTAKANLDFNRVAFNYEVLGFDINVLQRYRIRIDKEVVGWRHGVAHGSAPNLDELDASHHVDFVSELLIIVADCFQEAMLKRI